MTTTTTTAVSEVVENNARAVVAHVEAGGFLGASWPRYACTPAVAAGWRPRGIEAEKFFDLVLERAEEIRPGLWLQSSQNFEAA